MKQPAAIEWQHTEVTPLPAISKNDLGTLTSLPKPVASRLKISRAI
jgi:hypothetical protein